MDSLHGGILVLTPQELIDLPGYGKSIPHLKKQRQWDEYNGLEYRGFLVSLEAEIKVEDTIIIKARHQDEAEELAVKKFADNYDCDELDVETINIKDSKEG